MPIKVRRLAPSDAALIPDFSCGHRRIDVYLAQAFMIEEFNLARLFPAFEVEDRSRIAGFYALHNLHIEVPSLPAGLAVRLRRDAVVGAVYVAMFAVRQDRQGRGIGTALFRNMLGRVKRIAAETGIWAVVLDPLNARAEAFYRRFGFETLDSTKGRLFLPVSAIG